MWLLAKGGHIECDVKQNENMVSIKLLRKLFSFFDFRSRSSTNICSSPRNPCFIWSTSLRRTTWGKRTNGTLRIEKDHYFVGCFCHFSILASAGLVHCDQRFYFRIDNRMSLCSSFGDTFYLWKPVTHFSESSVLFKKHQCDWGYPKCQPYRFGQNGNHHRYEISKGWV